MFVERPEGITNNDWLAQRVVNVKDALNGASNCMKVTPFLAAHNRDDLTQYLEVFAEDIANGASSLQQLLRFEDPIEFDREASGAEIIAETLLSDPSEQRVWKEFDRARASVTVTFDAMKTIAKTEARIPADLGVQAMMNINTLHNVVKGVETFYRRVPAEAAADFIFR
jgi:hypothetical protein